jgi:hypothetical protein
VRDAVGEGVLEHSTHTVTHRQTGKPHELRTLRVNEDHPLVKELTSDFGETAPEAASVS